jgi:murein DD-endopeptidase MepM/ murein hydrolase activator NlpD
VKFKLRRRVYFFDHFCHIMKLQRRGILFPCSPAAYFSAVGPFFSGGDRMAEVSTKFSIQKNAFRFLNRFEFDFPVKFKLPLAGEVDLSKTVLGLCGGMCFAALDHFYSGEPLPEAANQADIDPGTLVYLCDRQLDSLSIPVVLKIIEWMLIDRSQLAQRMARYEIPKLRRQLDRGDPVVLALIRVQGVADPTHNHQVLATAYTYDAATRELILSLYDPNHPGESPTIRLNLDAPRAGFTPLQSTGEPLRAFFVVPYQRRAPLLRAAPRAGLIPRGGLPFHLQWPVDSRRVNQFFGENPDSYRPFGLPGHEGLDLFALTGANIYAAADGEVTLAGHPSNHPYGLHVRIRHEAGGKVFHTTYGHLTSTLVREKQHVTAGTLIGLADNTGNSFGSHLHLTLKIEGEQTPGYPAGIVDPWPYLQEQEEAPPAPEKPLPAPSGLTVYTAIELNLRAGPGTANQVVAGLPAGEALSPLGEAAQVKPKIGKQDEWLQVQTASGQAGFVAAWFVQPEGLPFPPSDLVIYPFDALNLRSGPGTGFDILAGLTLDDPLTVLGDAGLARSRLGQQNAWLQVETRAGLRGFVAAWLVHSTGQSAPSAGLVVFPTVMLNVRARPAADANILTVALPGDALAVLGDKAVATARIGQADQWLNVRTPQGHNGFVAAWLVTSGQAAQPGNTPTHAPGPAPTSLSVFPTAGVNLRAQPSTNSPRVTGANMNEPLKVIEADLAATKAKIGKQDAWVYTERGDGARGWVAAWFLSLKPV